MTYVHSLLKRHGPGLLLLAAVLGLLIAAAQPTQAQYSVLHNFNSADGANPLTGLIFDSQGNLYGVTYQGGNNGCNYGYGCGVVFELSPPSGGSGSWTETVLYTFTGGSDGGMPRSSLIFDSQGNLYGTTQHGGNLADCSGCGVVFELSPPSGGGPWTEAVLYTFTGGSDGGSPYAGLIFDSKGNLYGTTGGGGTYGYGTVFELSPPSGGIGPWTETVLYSFTGGSDGWGPFAGLIFDSNGNLYGTTPGVVYELSPPSGVGPWTETVLYSFTGKADGSGATAGLVFDSQGNLYGTAEGGGNTHCSPGCGVVFELSPPSGGVGPWNETVLYSFTGGSDGWGPFAGLMFDSKGNLYGTTLNGGVTHCAEYSCGVVFELSPPSGGVGPWNETVQYSFTGGSDGDTPWAGVISDSQGNLYGTTQYGGDAHSCSGATCGVVYELTPAQIQSFALTANPKALTIAQGNIGTSTITVVDYNGFDGEVTLSASGLPSGVTAEFVPNPTTTTSTLTLKVGAGAPVGSSTVTISGVSGSLTNQTTIKLTVTAGGPIVSLSPKSLTFPKTVVGVTSKPHTVTLTNTGVSTLNITSIATSGDFAIQSKTCGATLAPKANCKVKVTFTPTQVGTRSGALTFTDNAPDSPQSVALSGTGIAPATLTPASATFPKQKVGTASKPKTFTLTNNQSVTLNSIAISTTGDFAVSATTCGTSLAAKKKCTISVTFTPTQTGTRTGQLSASDSASNSPQTATLKGTGY